MVRMTFGEYDGACMEFAEMGNPDPGWLPDPKDLYGIAAQDPDKYAMFLAYLAETSSAMGKGGAAPRLVNEILRDSLELEG